MGDFGSMSLKYLIALFIGILSFSWTEPADDRAMHIFQFSVIFILTLCWAFVTVKLNTPTTAQKKQEQQNLNKAISMAGDTGVTQEWYNQIGDVLHSVTIAIGAWVASFIMHSVIFAYPDSVFEIFANYIQNHWENILNNYTHKQIFVAGLWLSDFITFWVFGLCYAFLDLTRPSLLLPFKVQQAWSLSKKDFLMAVERAMINQLLVLLVVYYLWEIYPLLSPNGFSKELPTLFETIISLLLFIPFSEVWFWSWHYLCHKSDWAWSHIHYIHHEFTAPIGIAAVYAHPVEHLWINIITVMLGPFVMGSHVTLWCLFAALSIQNTVMAHSGWHLPFLGSPDNHDFHHFAGWDNFGVVGVLDDYFGTNELWLNSWKSLISGRYGNQDYAVDKILAANGQPFNDKFKLQKETNINVDKIEETDVDMDWEVPS